MNVKSAFLPDSKVQIYFIVIQEYFNRSGLYTDRATGKDFPDNAERFAYFCKGALETLKILSWRPDIIHCNDWQSALAPYYLQTVYKDDDFLQGIKSIFTIHNFSYQGIFKKSMAPTLEIQPEEIEENGAFENDGKLNLLKGAINYSDQITTVSETYAREISTKKEFGYGLETVLQKKPKVFSGILNGVDYTVWSPSADKKIPFKYTVEDMEGKNQNKQALLTRVNLKYQEDMPVIGMISRVVEQKGFSLLLEAMDQLMELNVQLIILGTGDKKIEKQIHSFQKKHSGKISLNQAFDETLAHMIEAGSDIFLMPSAYEPCGMNQMYSLKYGTIPIVHKVGGLAETITEYNPDDKSGNGFVFEKYTAKDFMRAVKRALRIYKKNELWKELQLSIMQEDFSWDRSAKEYLDLYMKMLDES
jgi:starch synthase